VGEEREVEERRGKVRKRMDVPLQFRKVYPMTLTEQTEMDAFLEEALATGCIRQSKSPLGALIFFIKKKDGKLCFVQDYRALNAITRRIGIRFPSSTTLSIGSRMRTTSPS
jgi:hypothetical protein